MAVESQDMRVSFASRDFKTLILEVKTVLPHLQFKAKNITENVHENKSDIHDVSLILLANNIPNEFLPVTIAKYFPNEMLVDIFRRTNSVVLAGFGPTSFAANHVSGVFHAQYYPEPKAAFTNEKRTEAQFRDPVSACPGDSGGGIFKFNQNRLELVGVVISGDMLCGGPTVTWVASPEIRNWIESSVADLEKLSF